ncbi:MAG: hypothetical protein CMI60_06680 [Parvibaculum sp.]|nr:hypothetical protein [Parvibaculum sp.]
MSIDTSTDKIWTGRRILIGLSAFFLSVFAANGIMVFYALSTFDGVETDNAYRKGRAYNHVLEADAAQNALGWTTAIEIMSSRSPGGVSVYTTVIVTTTDGQAAPLVNPTLTFWRPTVQGMDVEAVVTAAGDGTYQSVAQLQRPGNWIVRLNAETTDGRPYVYEERQFIQPGAE